MNILAVYRNQLYSIVKSNFIYKQFPNWSKEWFISLEVRPLGTVYGKEASIFHLGQDGLDGVNDRVPAVYFHPGTTKLHFVYGAGIQYDVPANNRLPVGEWTLIQVSQIRLSNNLYKCKLQVGVDANKKPIEIYSTTNVTPVVYGNMNFYIGDAFKSPAYANYRDVEIFTFQEGWTIVQKFQEF